MSELPPLSDLMTTLSISSHTPPPPIQSQHQHQSQNQQEQTQPQTFHPFPRLPLELRIKIYVYINHIPRTVNIEYKSVFTKSGPDGPADDGEEHGSGWGRAMSARRSRLAVARRFVSRWVSNTPPPACYLVSREMREESLKISPPAFGTLKGPAKIYFNFASDTLYFGNASSIPPVPEIPSTSPVSRSSEEQEEGTPVVKDAAPYRLDLYLGGDQLGGVTTTDINRVKYLAIDVAEELYGRRSFCWADVRSLVGLEKVTLVAWEEKDELDTSLSDTQNQQATRLMQFYTSSLKRVCDKYANGYGEGLLNDGGEGESTEWKVPRIEVWNAYSGRYWGEVKL